MTSRELSFWDRVLERRISRRALIRTTAALAAGAAARPRLGVPLLAAAAAPATGGPPPLRMERFTPIEPSTRDELVLPPEFSYRTLIRWRDPVNDKGDWFGFNCDFTAFLPLVKGRRPAAGAGSGADHLRVGLSAGEAEGLYVVNHEYPDPTFLPSVPEQQYSVGLSVVHLRRAGGRWEVRRRSRYARRYTAASPARLSGPAAGLGGKGGAVVGTVGNCSGAVTPWGTVLSCEENTEEYGKPAGPGGYGWGSPYTTLEHYGWVVEVDPYDPEWLPVKRTALGRFRHENVAIRIASDGRLVAYMGDDAVNRFVYKYVSEGRYDPSRGLANGELLDRGRLHAAACEEDGSGSWTPLPDTEECLRDTHGYIVREGLPATPMERPEDLEVHPLDGSVYIALTHNLARAPGSVLPPEERDPYGKVARFVEEDGDPTATSFRWEVFAVGGPDAGFAAPDNLEFDRAGNLWIVCDMAEGLGDAYAAFGNNGMFMVPTAGPDAAVAYQFASAPVAAELSGPWLSPDETTLFLAVQHPGQRSGNAEEPTSRWPDGRGAPRPSCVAIRRRQGGTL